ncbi:hypothetical protein ACFPRL_30555 [Pseudoclavibacter helvolus]
MEQVRVRFAEHSSDAERLRLVDRTLPRLRRGEVRGEAQRVDVDRGLLVVLVVQRGPRERRRRRDVGRERGVVLDGVRAREALRTLHHPDVAREEHAVLDLIEPERAECDARRLHAVAARPLDVCESLVDHRSALLENQDQLAGARIRARVRVAINGAEPPAAVRGI